MLITQRFVVTSVRVNPARGEYKEGAFVGLADGEGESIDYTVADYVPGQDLPVFGEVIEGTVRVTKETFRNLSSVKFRLVSWKSTGSPATSAAKAA